MPARVVIALTEPDAADQIAAALNRFGIDAKAFSSSMAALVALDDAHTVEVLVTSIDFASNAPNGVALARMARAKRRNLKSLFIDKAALGEFTDGLGEFMASPVTASDAVRAILRLLPPRV